MTSFPPSFAEGVRGGFFCEDLHCYHCKILPQRQIIATYNPSLPLRYCVLCIKSSFDLREDFVYFSQNVLSSKFV